MNYFLADNAQNANACSTCCCQKATIKPGSVDKWTIGYASFSLPIGGNGITCNTIFDIQPLAQCGNDSLLKVAAPELNHISASSAISGNLFPLITSPVGSVIKFKYLPIHGPMHGTVSINVNGAYTYTPDGTGGDYEHFFYEVDDGVNTPVIGEVIIAVDPIIGPALSPPSAALATPALKINNRSVNINSPMQTLNFGLAASASARFGDSYRLQIKQPAVDCDGQIYYHISCYDITISQCG